MKIICLDYDGSYTEFPELFNDIIIKCKAFGYTVIMATMRHENEKDSGLEYIETIVDKLIFTGRKAKKTHLESIGIKPDLWIDDNPKWILNDA
jgi:DNA-binding LacI/PurR family transcriptional regulator